VDPVTGDRCHHLAVRDWERAGGWQFINVFAAIFFVIGALYGLLDVIGALVLKDVDTGGYDRLPELRSALFTVVWLTLMWRIMRSGIYYGDEGVRIRTLPRTVTYPWAEIATAEARGNDLWLVLTNERELKTPVRRVEWRSGYRRRNGFGISLSPGDFNVLLNQLQSHVNPGR
jgi:hypothetical protein